MGRFPNKGRGGRGGRGSGRGRNNTDPKAVKKKKSIEDYNFYIGSSKQAADYNTTAEFLINYIKKEYTRGNDVAEALRLETDPVMSTWEPALTASTSTDVNIATVENEQYKMKYKAELDAFMKRKSAYEENMFKAYGLLWERCAKSMQNKISTRADYESAIYNKPINLLKAIKEHALNYQETRYAMSIVSDALRTVFGTTQKEGESLQDYTTRFKTSREVLESHLGGPIVLKKYVKTMNGYDVLNQNKVEALTKITEDQLFAYIYMENADQTKYGTILKGFNNQKSLGNDQYPKTMLETAQVFSNHVFDSSFNKKKQEQQRQANKDRKRLEKDKDNDDEDSPVLSFAQMEGVCYCCGKAGHKSPDCRQKNKITKEDWAINKSQQHAQVADAQAKAEVTPKKGSDESGPSGKEEKHIGWMTMHCERYSFAHIGEMKDWILLDSDSTDTIFCNPEYVHDIRSPQKQGESCAMLTNGGSLVSNLKCTVPNLGEHWYNENSITNIISLADMTAKYRVTMDSGVEKALCVHLPNKVVKFKQMKNGLYGMNPKLQDDDGLSPLNIQLLNTVKENTAFLTPRQQNRAKKARQLYHAVGCPTVDDLKAMIRMNLIKNNQVTTEDVNLAERVFGPDVATIKGRATRTRPSPVVSNIIELPDELIEAQKDVAISMDGMTVNGLKFLTTVSHELFYRTSQYVSTPVANIYRRNLDEIYGVYKRGGFTITDIHCDNEFHAAMDPYSSSKDPAIRMHYVAAQEHVPRAERNNRVIKERVRATYHQMPYLHMPKIMVKYAVMEATRKLNFSPSKHGVSKHYSPRMIIDRVNVDFERDCKYAFGEYVQAVDEPNPTNTNQARSLDCIYLRPAALSQNGHELLHLNTNKVVTRRRLVPCPITPSVIKQVHRIAQRDGMPAGLKIKNRAGVILFESASTAGVDFEDNEDYEDEDYSASDDEENEYDEIDYDNLDENELQDILNDTGIHQDDNEEEDPVGADEVEEEDNNIDQDEEQEIIFEEEDDEEDYEPSDQEDVPLEADAEEDENPGLRRIQRVRHPPVRFQHLQASEEITNTYDQESARIFAMTMVHFNATMSTMSQGEKFVFLQTYSLKQGIKKFGKRGIRAAHKEMQQLHDRVVFTPIRIQDMTPTERKRAMESLIFIAEKRDGTVKARTCANGSTQRAYTNKEDAASPTAATDAIIITGVVDAKEGRDVMTLDVPNAFVQTDVPQNGEKIVMKIRGQLVDLLVEISPEIYSDYVVYEGKNKVLYVKMLKALYGMMIASILYYRKFRKDIEIIGYVVNPYDVCVANKEINGSMHTVTWHVDDLKASHVDPKVNDKFAKWCEDTYGSEKLGHVKVVRGTKHDYLAMILDFSEKGVMKLDMRYYIDGMLDEFPYPVVKKKTAPWTDKLFQISENSNPLDKERQEIFHTFLMKAMFLCKRARPDINPSVPFLASRVKDTNESDWNKLTRLLGFLSATRDDVLKLEKDDSDTITWYVDASFAVHKDMKSHTGAMMTLGKGCITGDSTKQKTNARSSTESELQGVDDEISKIVWTKLFMEWQGILVKENIVYQDNTSAMKLELNGRTSCGKRTRHFHIKLFYISDLITRGEVIVKYCPTDDMLADYMTKALVGAKFGKLRDFVMNLTDKVHKIGQQECVERVNEDPYILKVR